MNNLYLFASVRFLTGSMREYWYISDDYSIKAGDYVAVLVEGNPQICQVINTCMYSKETAPYNVNEAKHIVSKVDKATAFQTLMFQDEVIDEKYKDCGYYTSRYFSARDLPIKTDSKIFEFSGDSIAGLILPEDKVFFEVDYEEPFLLPDGYKTAHLFNFIPADPKLSDGQDLITGLRVKTLIIPKGYSNVELQDCCIGNLFISNGVEKITIPLKFYYDCNTLRIPKDLKEIEFDSGLGFDNVKAYNFDKIMVDPENKVYKLKDGVLYKNEDGHKYIVWISKYINHLIVDEDVDGIYCLRPNLELEIKNNSFFSKQYKYLLEKLKIFTYDYDNQLIEFLNKFKSVYVEAIYQDELIDREHIENLITGNGVTVFNNFKCRQSFLDSNKWIVEGCSTLEDFEKFVNFDLEPHDDFLGFVKRGSRHSKTIVSIVNLLENLTDKDNIDYSLKEYLYFGKSMKEFTWWGFLPVFKDKDIAKEIPSVELLNAIRNKLIKY